MAQKIKAFYWLPKCSTCQKAETFLKDKGLTIETYVDVKTEKVDKETIKQLAQGVGGIEQLFSKRALKYRAMGLHLKTLTEDEMLDLMHEEYTFIKRPVIVTSSGKTLAGFSKKQYEGLVS
jgi:arsenate reductase (glutaredoxin)